MNFVRTEMVSSVTQNGHILRVLQGKIAGKKAADTTTLQVGILSKMKIKSTMGYNNP
jgi:hypothetical protein